MQKHNRRFAGALLLATTLVLASCSPENEPELHPTSAAAEDTAASSAPEEPTRETELLAPPVSSPLDATNIEACNLISAQSATTLGYDAGSAKMIDDGMCLWNSNENAGAMVSLRTNIGEGGLSAIYEIRDTYAVFDEMTVGNYPAVHAHTIEDESRCVLYTGIADDQYLATDFIRNTLDSFDSCQAAIEFTEAAITDLPAAS
ncbi:DUF3558 domain-containing protein [Actinoalloteichus spitiensis]|uniref:DUF3558 domain-containing protein n=1 Tax=Actinoalloteichus spitiensis TaxID=252394 RepID=UPI0012F6EC2C|nr:DUF3558 domain-containing protein [Actinoalloteichus spitiensis]